MKVVVCIRLSALLTLVVAGSALAQGYHVGQKVELRDDYYVHGGGWVPATITVDYGPGSMQEFMVRVDGRTNQEAAVFGQIRPADGSAAPPWPSNDPAKMQALNNFKPIEESGPSTAGQHGRKVAAVAPEAVPTTSSAPPRAVSATTAAQAPVASVATAAPPRTANVNAVAAGSGKRISTGGGPGYSPFGRFPSMSNGNNPNYALGHNGVTPPGRENFIVQSSPGDAFPVGRWALKVGGQFTNVGGPDRNGSQLQEWGGVEKAEKVAINADGTWTRSAFGSAPAARGKWVDIGYNVVRLLDYGGPNSDYTASVWNRKLTIKMGGGGNVYEGMPY